MSSIGSHIAASVAAQALTERQATSAKSVEDREKSKLRRDLADRFSPSTAYVEEGGAVARIEADEESPADARDQERARARADDLSVGQRAGEHPGTLDIRA
jgi:hypothetical protein